MIFRTLNFNGQFDGYIPVTERLGFITGRNEVVAKVMFLQVSVILLTGGGGLLQGESPAPAGRPPRARRTPPGP